MRQHIVPVRECGWRNRIRRSLESTKSRAQQVADQSTHDQNQNGNGYSEFLAFPHVGSKFILSLSTQSFQNAAPAQNQSTAAADQGVSGRCQQFVDDLSGGVLREASAPIQGEG